MAADHSTVGMCHQVFIHSSADNHLHGFQFGVVLTRAVLNILYITFGQHTHSYLWGYLLCGRIAGPEVDICLALVNTASFSQWLFQPVRTFDVEPTEATMRTLSVGAGLKPGTQRQS